MPLAWDDNRRQQLLLVILHLTAPNAPKWEQVASLIGEGVTGEACRQQFKNLRAKAKKEYGDIGGPPAAEEGAEKKTPAKGRGKKANGESAAKSGGKRKGSKAAEGEEGAETSGDAEESPSKKVKMEGDQNDFL